MARVVNTKAPHVRIGKAGPNHKYPYDEWFDGQVRELLIGQDFKCSHMTMSERLKKLAKERGFVISCYVTLDPNNRPQGLLIGPRAIIKKITKINYKGLAKVRGRTGTKNKEDHNAGRPVGSKDSKPRKTPVRESVKKPKKLDKAKEVDIKTAPKPKPKSKPKPNKKAKVA